MSERVIALVDMNAFFAAVEQQAHPSLRGQPVIVCGNPTTRSVVAACSYEAKAFGITNGMPVWEARRLCPHVIPVGGDPDKYVEVARGIFAILESFTPRMEVFSIDEAFLDLTDGAAPPDAVARRIKQRIRDAYGLTCSIGLGPNKLLAKAAAKFKKPDGLVWVRPAEVPALMERLPIQSLCGIGPRLTVLLNDLGISTCGELGRAPEALLVKRFGLVGRSLKRMGQGQDASPVVPAHRDDAVKSMGHAYTLPRDTPSMEDILGTLLRLSEQVGRRLRAERYQGRTVGLTLRYADFSTVTHEATGSACTDSGLQIYRAARELFRRHCDPLAQRVRLVGVGVSQLVRGERQLTFLEDRVREERLDRCLDRINDRFGECAVVRAAALEPLVAKTHGFLLKHPQRRGNLILR